MTQPSQAPAVDEFQNAARCLPIIPFFLRYVMSVCSTALVHDCKNSVPGTAVGDGNVVTVGILCDRQSNSSNDMLWKWSYWLAYFILN